MLRKRPLLGVFILFCLGIILQGFILLPFWLGVGSVILCLALSALFIHKSRISLVFLSCAFFLLGYVCFSSQKQIPSDHIIRVGRQSLYRNVLLEGVVVSPVVEREAFGAKKMVFTLESRLLERRWVPTQTQGRVLVNIFRPRPFLQYGDYVRLWGKLHPPFAFEKDGRTSYIDYLKRKGIFLVLDVKKTSSIKIKERHQANRLVEWSLNLRFRLAQVFKKYLSEAEAGIMQAVILGERSQTPKPVKEMLIRTGTAHVLAISGLHVGIVAAIIFVFLKLFSLKRRWQYILTIILLAAYALLTGMRPSVVRATIMASIFLSSFILERETDSINTLAGAGLVILLLNPLNLFDVGFQLSFASVFTIIVLYPFFWAFLSAWPIALKNKFIKFILQSFCVSIAAWLGVVGLILYYFGIITPLSVFANIIIIPLITGVVGLGVGLLITGVFLPFGACSFSACLKMALNLLILTTYLIAKAPFSYFEPGPQSLGAVFIYYILLAVFCVLSLRCRRI